MDGRSPDAGPDARPARWRGWSYALITLLSAVLRLSLLLLPRSPSPRAVYSDEPCAAAAARYIRQ